jgi:hypothetical protein
MLFVQNRVIHGFFFFLILIQSFCVDIQARESAPVEDDSVPLYDREFTLGSTPLGDSSCRIQALKV